MNSGSSAPGRRVLDGRRPLLIVDGDSFAHRAYHGLPKSLRRADGGGGGAIVGFANFLLRLHADEQPRAVLVGWDTLDAPTYRHKAFPAYQGGRHFDEELLDQLDLLPRFVSACGFAFAKAPGYEADDFLAAAAAAEEQRGGTALVASGDRDTFLLASDATAILQPVRGGEMARIGPAEVRERYGVDLKQCLTSSQSEATLRTSCRVRTAWDRRAPLLCCARTARWKMRSPRAAFPLRPSSCASIAGSRRWTRPPRFRRCPINRRPGQAHRSSPGNGGSINWRIGWASLAGILNSRYVSEARRDRTSDPRPAHTPDRLA